MKRKRNAWLWMCILLIAGALGLVGFACYFCFVNFRALENFETACCTQDALNLYLSRNPGKIPTDWNDFESEFREINEGGYGYEDMSYVRKRIEIDFQALAGAMNHGSINDIILLRDGMPLRNIEDVNERLHKQIRAIRSRTRNQ